MVIFDFGGIAYFIDGATGQVLDWMEMGGLVEASPAVYENMLVVGSRDMAIWGVEVN